MKADPIMAKLWFERGEIYGERECHNGLGIIWRDGLIPGFKADLKKALYHFTAAANKLDLAEAHVNIAKLHLSAFSHLTLSSHLLIGFMQTLISFLPPPTSMQPFVSVLRSKHITTLVRSKRPKPPTPKPLLMSLLHPVPWLSRSTKLLPNEVLGKRTFSEKRRLRGCGAPTKAKT